SVTSPTLLILFFLPSRRRHTRFSRDWSSDVCSSDLLARDDLQVEPAQHLLVAERDRHIDELDDRPRRIERPALLLRQEQVLALRGGRAERGHRHRQSVTSAPAATTAGVARARRRPADLPPDGAAAAAAPATGRETVPAAAARLVRNLQYPAA